MTGLAMDRLRPAASGSGQAGLTILEAFASIVVLGLALALFMKLYGSSQSTSIDNAKVMRAGQILEQHVEAMRIHIASDTAANWPPRDSVWIQARMMFTRRIVPAVSPRDKAVLPNVRRVDLTALWGSMARDTLQVSTYVAKRF